MRQIAEWFTEKSYAYTQVCREGDMAIYEQAHQEGTARRYEVIRILVAPASIAPSGSQVPEREVYPSARQWGTLGWTHFTLAEAQAHYAQVISEQGTP